MDGLLSARSPERMLEIMKDSRVGAHASMSLFGLLLLKFTLLASLKPSMMVFLILLPVLSRWTVQIAMIGFPYARKEGLGKGFHETSRWLVFIFEGLAILVFSTWLIGATGPITLVASVLFVLIFCWRVSALLGGLTGDIYGALIELTEVVALLVAFPLLR